MIGQTISHYKILEKLGEGGMGIVYKAEDTKLKRTVALKFLPPDLTRASDAKERFIHEAQAASALQHLNICTVHDIDETDGGRLFIVMDLYEGEPLKSRIARGPLRIEEAIDIAVQLAEGLANAHEKGIVHRDIKPANIIITNDGVVKIVDFGLAKLAGQSRVTKTGSTVGTASYMSPEQAQGMDADERTDIWSFGVLLYEMLTGKLPFTADHETALMYQIVNTEPEPIEKHFPDCSPVLTKLVERALTKDLSKRYQTMNKILGELKTYRDQLHPEIGSRQTFLQRKKSTVAIGLVTLLVAGASIAYWLVTQKGNRELIGQIESAALAHRFDEAYQYLQERRIPPGDSKLESLVSEFAGRVTFECTPAPARVVLKRVTPVAGFPTREKLDLGVTMIAGRVLVAGEYWVEYSAKGMNPLQFLITVSKAENVQVQRTMVNDENPTRNMVYIEAGTLANGASVDGFLIDKFEVTNEEFLKFVLDGGYRNEGLWEAALLVKGQEILWKSAVKIFVDRTGISGPRFWSGGKFPDGTGKHPVVGVSWYEANAFARWVGKKLPTWNQWWRAALAGSSDVFPWGSDVRSVQARANFGLLGTQDVGSYRLGVSPFGCYDMAGNVGEWLSHPGAGSTRRAVVGGSWKDPEYMFEPGHAELFDPTFASDGLGFRCVRPLTKQPPK